MLTRRKFIFTCSAGFLGAAFIGYKEFFSNKPSKTHVELNDSKNINYESTLSIDGWILPENLVRNDGAVK